VAALTAVVIAVVSWQANSGEKNLAAPQWITGPVECRRYPLAHVYHRERLELIKRCVTVGGTVKRVAYVPSNGNYKLFVVIERRYEELLEEGNHGMLAVEISPTDQPVTPIPKAGQRAIFYGSWVREGTRVAVHPAWAVQIGGEIRTRNTRPTLRLQTNLPPSVPLGESIGLLVRVESAATTKLKPVSQAHLFAELLPARGPAVDWEAASTNTLGFARLSFTALQLPGIYRIRLYGLKGNERGRVEFSIKIRRR
jgi:hypothetical protein